MRNFRVVDRFAISGGWKRSLQENIDFLKQNKIVAILDLEWSADNIIYAELLGEKIQEAGIKFESLVMSDDEFNLNLAGIFERSEEILAEWDEEFPKGKILIKCGFGVSRSPAILTNYLAIKNRWDWQQAIDFVEKSADNYIYTYLPEDAWTISINPVFMTYLIKKFPAASAFGEKE